MEQDTLKLSAFIAAICRRFRDRANIARPQDLECALAALGAWEDADEAVELTEDCANAIADTDLEYWEV